MGIAASAGGSVTSIVYEGNTTKEYAKLRCLVDFFFKYLPFSGHHKVNLFSSNTSVLSSCSDLNVISFAGDVWKLMRRYGKEMRAASSVTIKLYPFMHELQDKYECDTDDESGREREECDTTLRYTLEPESESYKDNTP